MSGKQAKKRRRQEKKRDQREEEFIRRMTEISDTVIRLEEIPTHPNK